MRERRPKTPCESLRATGALFGGRIEQAHRPDAPKVGVHLAVIGAQVMRNAFDARGTTLQSRASRFHQPIAVMVLALCWLAVPSISAGCSSTCGPAADLSAGSVSPTARAKAERLLQRYNLHLAGPPRAIGAPEPGGPAYQLLEHASRHVCLDLNGHTGKTVRWYAFPVRERSQATEGTITANVAVSGDEVVGAGLLMSGYCPGVVALNDRHAFAAPGLRGRQLRFLGIKSVEVERWREGESVQRHVTLTDKPTIRRLLSIMESSTYQSGDRSSVNGDEEYFIMVNYESGPEVLVRLTTSRKSGETFLTLDTAPFLHAHFDPSPQLKATIKRMLDSR